MPKLVKPRKRRKNPLKSKPARIPDEILLAVCLDLFQLMVKHGFLKDGFLKDFQTGPYPVKPSVLKP